MTAVTTPRSPPPPFRTPLRTLPGAGAQQRQQADELGELPGVERAEGGRGLAVDGVGKGGRFPPGRGQADDLASPVSRTPLALPEAEGLELGDDDRRVRAVDAVRL